MPRDPVNMYSRASVFLVVTNALPEMLNEPSVLSASIVVKTQSIVSDETVCINVNVVGIIIFNAELDANANRNDLARRCC